MEIQDAEFDKFVEHYDNMRKYSTRMAGHNLNYYDEYKIKEIARVLGRDRCDQPLHILNFGCGIGKSEPYFCKYFPQARLLGVDVSAKSIEYAEGKCAHLHNVTFAKIDEHQLVLTQSFDLIFISNVFHHIDHARHHAILTYLKSKLNKGGKVFMFEHNPNNPLTIKAVNDCEFDENAVLLRPSYAKQIFEQAQFTDVKLRYTLFFPAILSVLNPVEIFLNKIPIGGQYYIEAL